MIARTIALRKKNPHLTIMISVGGWGEGSTKYSEMVRTETNRKAFIQSAVDFIKQHDFDGLDLDWYYYCLQINYQVFKRFFLPGSTPDSPATAVMIAPLAVLRTRRTT